MQQAFDVQGNTAKYALTLFGQSEFLQFWPQIEDMLDAVPHTWRHWTKEHIYDAILTGRAQCWGMGPPPNAVFCAITSVHEYPAERIFVMDWAAGKFDSDMAPLLYATMEQYAQANNCTRIEVRGRAGWDKLLKSQGFAREAFVWSRPINMKGKLS